MSDIVSKAYNKLGLGVRFERIWKIAHIDFKKRYYDSYFGLIWALLNPLFHIAIYYFVFTVFFPRNIDNFALYLFSGLISWMYFKECTNKCMTVLKQKSYLIDSLQFDKIDLFYSTSISSMLGYLFNICAYILIALCFGILYNISLVAFAIIIFNIFILSIAIGMILATVKIYFRDISYFWDLATLFAFWTCPIFFRGEDIVAKAPFILYVNPVSGIIMNSRSMLLHRSWPDWYWVCYDLVFAIILFYIAKVIFNKFSHKALEYM